MREKHGSNGQLLFSLGSGEVMHSKGGEDGSTGEGVDLKERKGSNRHSALKNRKKLQEVAAVRDDKQDVRKRELQLIGRSPSSFINYLSDESSEDH